MPRIVAGIDLGGTAVNYTLLDADSGEFLIPGLAEHPARAKEGAEACLTQIVDGLAFMTSKYGVDRGAIVAVGLDTPGPASATGVLSARGSTNFAHESWPGFDLRGGLEAPIAQEMALLADGLAERVFRLVRLQFSFISIRERFSVFRQLLSGRVSLLAHRLVTTQKFIERPRPRDLVFQGAVIFI